MNIRHILRVALVFCLLGTVAHAGISVSSPTYRYRYFNIWYGLGQPYPGKVAYVAVTKPNGYYYTVASAENVSDYSQFCQVYADMTGWYTFYYDYSYYSQGVQRTTVLTQSYYIYTGNNVQWDPPGYPTYANLSVVPPGQSSTITAGFKNIGVDGWGGNHYIEFKDHYGTPIYYASVSGVGVNVSTSRSYTVNVPSWGSPSTATYHLRAEENNVEMFGPQRDVPIGVDYPPSTSLAVSSTYFSGGANVQVTSVSSAPWNDLINQAIDYWAPGASDWVSGGSPGAPPGTRWDGGWSSSNTLAPWITVGTPGTWTFRARGQNSQGQLSNFQYQYVTVAAGAPPTTAISASSGSSNLGGNTDSTTPPVLYVRYGDLFTITSVSNDTSSDLVMQQFDLSANGGAWSIGNSSNGRLWTGGPTSGNTLAKTFNSAEFGAGSYRFRAQGKDAQNQYSTYQYIDVRISAPPVTAIVASITGSSTTGNSNSSTPPALAVTVGQAFTITSTSTDPDGDLMSQQFDISANGGTWSLANASNGRLWQSGPASSNTLAKTFNSSEFGPGTYRFRGQGIDAQSQTSTYQYVDVVISSPLPPSITTQPANIAVTAGQPATFSVGASGSPPLSYQWRKNGVSIAGANSASYTIASAQSGDAGTYSVVVSNSVGNTASGNAVLTVQTSPPVRLALEYWQPDDYPNRETGGGHWDYRNVWVDGYWQDYGHDECDSSHCEPDYDEYGNEIGCHDVCDSSHYVIDGYYWVDGHWEYQWVWIPDVAPNGIYGSRWDTTAGYFGDPRYDASGAYSDSTANRGSFVYTYAYWQKITFRAWGYAPGGNCNNYQARLYAPNGAFLMSGGFGSGGYWDCSFYPTWWGYYSGVFRVEISYTGATGASPTGGTVSYYIAVGVGAPPGSDISVDRTSIQAGELVNITVNASAPSNNLVYINVDQTSPNFGYYGAGDTGTEIPPSQGYYVSPNSSAYDRHLALRLGLPSGATTATYVFRSAVSDGSGWFYSPNTVSVVVTAAAPAIVTQPGNQTVAAGISAQFAIAASGAPAPTYQWQRQPAGTTGFTNLTDGNGYSGATTATLTVSGTTAAMSGDQFRCVATNIISNATSNAATLTVSGTAITDLVIHRP